jgi:hypothetical protein
MLQAPFLFYLCHVKKALWIVFVLPIIVLYCHISGIYSANHSQPERFVARAANQQHHFALSATLPLQHAVLTENVASIINLISLSQKNKTTLFWTARKVTELKLLNQYSKYTFFARNIINWFHPTDIIFPFHYFW